MMKEMVTFVTGNQNKADYLAKYLGFSVDHVKLDLDEIQSLDLREIVRHKVRQAYEKIQSPVIVAIPHSSLRPWVVFLVHSFAFSLTKYHLR